MTSVEPPAVLLVKLLRRSDAPSENDARRLMDAIESRLAEDVRDSTELDVTEYPPWSKRLDLLGT